jgi:hypothetical protein
LTAVTNEKSIRDIIGEKRNSYIILLRKLLGNCSLGGHVTEWS